VLTRFATGKRPVGAWRSCPAAVPIALSGVALALFCLLAVVVQTGVLRTADRALLLAIQGPAFEPLIQFGALLSALGAVEIELPLTGAGALWLWLRGHRAAALALLTLLPLSLVSAALKNVVDQPGVPPELHRVIYRLPSGELSTLGTFPSGHMLRAAYLCGLALIALSHRRPSRRRTRLSGAILILLVIMALSRPYLGEHWPSDVLGALLLASVPLSLAMRFWRSSALTPRPPLPILGEGESPSELSSATGVAGEQTSAEGDSPSPRIGRGGRG
jgi:undecaprenyl-diphosphatase